MFDRRLPFSRKQAAPVAANPTHRRVFLVVVDESDEMQAALRFACMRARNTGGRVALFTTVQQPEFQHWMFIGNLMQEEHRLNAEQRLQAHAAQVYAYSGEMPELLVREGDMREELISLLKEDDGISVVVLATGNDQDGPGPLISALTGKYSNKIRVPVTLVPGHLRDAEIDALA
jgi:hypothetical protein